MFSRFQDGSLIESSSSFDANKYYQLYSLSFIYMRPVDRQRITNGQKEHEEGLQGEEDRSVALRISAIQISRELTVRPFFWAIEEAEFAIWVTVLPGERLTDDTTVVLLRKRGHNGHCTEPGRCRLVE